MARPVLIFGISGATWDVATHLIARGRMNALGSLQERGCSFVLTSTRVAGDDQYRPQPAWATLLTGVEPAQHGITRFYHTACDLRAEPVWHAWLSRGYRVGLYGCPVSSPPSPLDGFVVPSHLARDARTWPPDLEPIKRLERRQQEIEREPTLRRVLAPLTDALGLHRLGVELPMLMRLGAMAAQTRLARDREVRSLLLRRAKFELGIDLFLQLCRRFEPKFMMFTTFFVDFVSHRYWRYFEPQLFYEDGPRDKRLASAVADAYDTVDRGLERIIGAVPDETFVAVVSEHGMRGEPVSAEIGRWRYLLRGSEIAALIGLADEVRARPVARWVAFQPRGRSLPKDTVQRLKAVFIRETNRPAFNVFTHGDEVVVKLALGAHDSPYRDVDLEQMHVSYSRTTVPFTTIATRAERARSAMHARDGILVFGGEAVRRSRTVVERAHLTDFAPTVLAACGLPVRSDMPGRVLNIFG